VFDLILLHAGRGLLSLGPSPMRVLLSETFPLMRAQLLQRPLALPSELSNAVENLRAKGGEFARAIGTMAAQLQPDQIRDAGALLAWRLGEARLREQALSTASQLPNSVALVALGLEGWPAPTAPLALAALIGDAWCHPRERVRPQTLLQLSNAPREKIVAMLEKLSAPFGTQPLSHASPQRAANSPDSAVIFLSRRNCSTSEKTRTGTASGAQRHGEFPHRRGHFGWVCRPESVG